MSQWIPTHVQCTIVRARDLRIKGKGGHNDAFVTIQLNKEKFQTSAVKSTATAEWNEECDLPLAHNNDWLVLTVSHKNFFGVDEFLGRCELPLNEFDWNERPRARWFALRAKQGKKHENKEHKLRGEVQIMLKFYAQNLALSTPDLTHKKSSLASALKHTIGASLRNLHKPGKNDGAIGFPAPLSRMNNANSKSNLSLAQQTAGGGADQFNNLPRGYNVSQTLPRNLGAGSAATATRFDSPGGILRSARPRSPSSVSQSVALSALDRTTKSAQNYAGDAAITSNNMPSPLLSSHQSRTSPTSLIDETFRESVSNVMNERDDSNNNNRFTVSPVNNSPSSTTQPVVTASRSAKAAAPAPPPPAPVVADSTKMSRRVPKVHKLTAAGGGGGATGSVVGNLLASNSSALSQSPGSNAVNDNSNPFEDDDNSPPPAPRGVGASKLNTSAVNGNNRRNTGSSSFYGAADGDTINNNGRSVSSARMGVASRGVTGNRRSTSSYGEDEFDAGQNLSFAAAAAENGGRVAGGQMVVNGVGSSNVATAVLNRSTSNRSSLISEQQAGGGAGSSGKGTSLERNQQPPAAAAQFYTNGNARNVNNMMANGYTNRSALPVSNLARVEATINSALKPLTQSRVPRDLELRYGHMERNDLLVRLAQLENDVESKDIEIDRMKSYLESLLSRVMEKCPELLHSSPE